MSVDVLSAQFHPVNVVDHPVNVTHGENGIQYVTSQSALPEYSKTITDPLEYWAEHAPERTFVAQRHPDGHWEKVSYAEALQQIRAIAQYLLNLNLDKERPVAILSGNSNEHLLLGMAAMYVGIPYAPISTAYSLISTDFGKLKHICSVLTPGLIFTDNLGPYRDAVDAVATAETQVVALHSEHAEDDLHYPLSHFADLLATEVTVAVDEAHAQVDGKTIAKFLFTSGSTGMPKGVINTQEMICANQEMLRSVFAFFKDEPPTLIDWLPWNHTFGGNHNVGIALYNGGTLYIDAGKPVPKGIATTMKNLSEIAPTIYFNVPKGYEFLAAELEKHPEIAANFFSNLKVMYFAGAGLSQHVWDRLDQLSIKHTGKKVPMLSGLGSTETAPAALFTSIAECKSGVVGVPAPGVELKLIPNSGKLEARVRGVSITPGYWRSPELTEKAYDEEGFYCLGDALKYIDPEQPNRGFRFDGRVSEDFKLDTGTWVSVGTLRPHIIHHFAPYVQDVVVCGRDRGFIAVMIFPDIEQCRTLFTDGAAELNDEQLVATAAVREVFQNHLDEMATTATGSSNLVRRLALQGKPPRIDAHEITDKGSLNQRAVMEARADQVEALYADQPDDSIICLS